MASNKAKQAGKTNYEMAKKSVELKDDIDLNVTFDDIGNKDAYEASEYRCTCCGKVYTKQKNNFTTTRSPLFKANNGYVNICNSCRDKYYTRLVNLYSGNEEKALLRMCQIFDWLFNEVPAGMSRENGKDRTRVNEYVNKLNLGQCAKHGSTYVDTIKNDFKEMKEEVIDSVEETKDSKTKKSTVKFFGTGFTEEDYDFLEEQYTDWTTRHECQSKAQEEVFKQLCFAQLDILKAKRRGDNAKDELKTFQDLLDTAKLKPKQINTDSLSSDRTFGQLIKLWEDEKPIPEPDEEFKDVDGIKRYISVFFLGHLAKMLGVKNKWSKMYEDEMSKYKVEKPEYEDDDEALFESVFSGHLEDED